MIKKKPFPGKTSQSVIKSKVTGPKKKNTNKETKSSTKITSSKQIKITKTKNLKSVYIPPPLYYY